MYRRIMVPLDGSPFGDYAIMHAVAVARRTGAEVELVHAHEFHRDESLESLTPYRYEGVTDTEEELDGLDWDDEQARLDGLARRLGEAHTVLLSARVIHGPAPGALTAHALEMGADLVVMSTHGHGGLKRRWIGSRADYVVRNAHTPVLLVRPPSESPPSPELPRFEHMLVPIDGSPLSEQVLPAAHRLGHLLGGNLTLLRVITNHSRARGDEEGDSRSPEEQVRAELSDVARRFERNGVKADIAVVSHRSPAEAILEAAQRLHVDLIGMATHGRSGLTRLVLGSIAEKVLQTSPLPLLLFGPGAARRKTIETDAIHVAMDAMLI